MRVVFVHGACVLDGSWWWHRTAALLNAHGISSVAALLPSCGEGYGTVPASSRTAAGLDEDAAAVRELLTDGLEPTLVVAHSYGGIVAAQAIDELGAAVGGPVRHLLLISSYLPEVGQTLSDFGGPEPAPFLDIDPVAQTFTVRPSSLAQTFLQDCPEVVPEAERRLARQHLSVTAAPVRAAGWHQLPTTYLVCAQDQGTPADRQRTFAARADTVDEVDAGHHRFLSRPKAVADLVERLGEG